MLDEWSWSGKYMCVRAKERVCVCCVVCVSVNVRWKCLYAQGIYSEIRRKWKEKDRDVRVRQWHVQLYMSLSCFPSTFFISFFIYLFFLLLPSLAPISLLIRLEKKKIETFFIQTLSVWDAGERECVCVKYSDVRAIFSIADTPFYRYVCMNIGKIYRLFNWVEQVLKLMYKARVT